MELLRIFAMLMIIAFHIFRHCVNYQLTDISSMERMQNGLFNIPVFYKRLLVLSSFAPLGHIGNNIFILISGYFLVPKGTEINLIKTSKKLLLQQLYAVVMLTFGSTIVWKLLNGTYIHLVNFNFFNSMSWFIGYYFLIVVSATVFLNKLLISFSRTQYTTFLFVMFALSQFSWTFGLINNLSSGFGKLSIGLFLFALGGFIKKYNPFDRIRTWALLAIIPFSFVFVYWSYFNVVTLKIEDYIRDGSTDLFIQTIPSYSDHSLICVLLGIVIFETFRRINIGTNKVINYISSSTLMVYLIHDNDFVYSLWRSQDWITLLHTEPFAFILKLATWTFGTFAICFSLYVVFRLISKLLISCRSFVIRE